MTKRLCVFCGSSAGNRPYYRAAAEQVGTLLAEKRITLVYGGGHVGLMGALADSMLSSGGEVIGVIPEALFNKELGHRGITKLHVVGSMHERKAMMADLADGFLALPGGYGTFEELFEVVTWLQLGVHRKPCGLLNVAGYFDHLLRLCDHAVAEGFLHTADRALIMSESDPANLVDAILTCEVPAGTKWLRLAET